MSRADVEHVNEPCGHQGDYDFTAFVPFHHPSYHSEMIKIKRSIIKRTYCDTCCTYWEKKYKEVFPK